MRFARGVEHVPLDLAERAPRASVPPLAYIPPPLQERSWGWYPEVCVGLLRPVSAAVLIY